MKDYPDSAAAKAALLKLGATGQSRSSLTTTQVWAGAGVDSMGAVSPDGKYLSFTDWSTNDLAIRDLKSGRTRRVTTNVNEKFDQWAEYSVPSPDGRRIAYAWYNKDTYQLRVIGIDGGEPRVLCCDESAAYIHPFGWSKDGKQILVSVTKGPRSAETTELLSISSTGGAARPLKTVSSVNRAAWSPDGEFIAYDASVAPDKDEHDLFIMRADGSNPMPVASHAANDVMLDWFPDGKRILFLSDRSGTNGVWTQAMSDGKPAGEPVLAKSDVGNVEGQGFAKDASYYYSVSSRTDEVLVARLDANGALSGRAEPLASRFAGGKQQAVWSPDGLSIAYVQTALTPGSTRALSIQVVATGLVRTIPVNLEAFANPAWMPDGKAIVLQGEQPQGGQGLYKIALDTGVLSPISGAVNTPEQTHPTGGKLRRYPAVSRDGREVLFTVGGGGNGGIEAHDLASGATRTVMVNPSRTFALSPDGRFIAATPQAQTKESLKPPVRIVPVTGGEPRALAAELEPANLDSGIAWSADGKYVFFARADLQGTALWRVPVDGGPAKRTGIVMRARILRVSAHPDGRLAISTVHGAEEIWVMRNLPAAGGK